MAKQKIVKNGRRRVRFTQLILVLLAFGVLGVFTHLITSANSNPFTIGSVTVISNSASNCPPGATCQTIRVTCSGIQQAEDASIAEYAATGAVRGVLVTSIGLEGNGWAFTQGQPLNTELRADGFKIVSINWANGWTYSAPGEDAGSGHLACRPAAAIKWVYETKYLPLGIGVDKIGKCGFCGVGHSGASTQITYALSHYGLDTILNAIVPFGGPSHGSLAQGCTLPPGNPGSYGPQAKSLIDSSHGYPFPATNGPCYTSNSSFTSRWNQESVETGGSDYHYAKTRVHLINGDQDFTMVPKGDAYIAKLNASGSPYVTKQILAGVTHDVLGTTSGKAAVRAAILADTGVPSSSSPPPAAQPPAGTPPPTSGSNPESPTSPNTPGAAPAASNEVPQTQAETSEAETANEVPKAAINALLNPSELPKAVTGPWGWAVVGFGIGTLAALGFAGWKLTSVLRKNQALKQFMSGIHK